MAVTIDLEQGGEAVQDVNGFRVIRVALVTNISSTPSAFLIDALADPAMPQQGDPHPDNGSIFVQSRVARSEGCTNARVEIVYQKPAQSGSFSAVQGDKDGPTVQTFNASLRAEQTTVDTAGTRLIVSPPLEVFQDTDARSARQRQDQSPLVTVLAPQAFHNHERLEDVHPAERVRDFMRKRNLFSEGPYGPRDLLLVNISSQSVDGGFNWQSTYTFAVDQIHQHNLPELNWIDPLTGSPHPKNDIVAPPAEPSLVASRIENVELYEDVDYGPLSITFG